MEKKKLPKMKETEEVVQDHGGLIVDPGREVKLTAVRHKIWIMNKRNVLDGIDYTMHDLIMEQATGFNPQPPMDYLDVLYMYYSHLYPFVENLIQEYEYNRESWRIMAMEQDVMLKKNTEYITENKILLEYLKETGTIEGYEGFKEAFKEKYKI